MKGKVVSLIVLMLFLTNMLSWIFGIQPVRAETRTFSDDFSSDSGMWEYLGFAWEGTKYTAYRDIVKENVVLTPNDYHLAGVIWFDWTFTSPFTVSFKYLAGGGSGADGLVMMFYHEKPPYLWSGASLSFIGSGYGLEFDNYHNYLDDEYGGPPITDPSDNHIAIVKDNPSNHLTYVNDSRTEDNVWHSVTAVVDQSSIVVYVDSEKVVDWEVEIDRAYGGFGFAGTTGAFTNRHFIDDFSITIGKETVIITGFDAPSEVGAGSQVNVDLKITYEFPTDKDYYILVGIWKENERVAYNNDYNTTKYRGSGKRSLTLDFEARDGGNYTCEIRAYYWTSGLEDWIKTDTKTFLLSVTLGDFSITASPTSLTIQPGNSDTSLITVTSINGFDQPVQLAMSGAPPGVTTTLNPEEVTPPPDGSTTSTLTVSVDTTATPGNYNLTATGTHGTLTQSVNVSLGILTPSPKFNVGDSVWTIADLNVRVGPGLNYAVIGTMLKGNKGLIFSGPVSADGYLWWNVSYCVGVTGWSAENWLKLTPPPSPPPQDFSSWAQSSISWAEQRLGSENWKNLCLRFVANAFMREEDKPAGWPSALNAAREFNRYNQDPYGWQHAPKGAIIFFDKEGTNPYGHVGVYLGNGSIIHAYGTVKINTTEEAYENRDIGSYLGWSYPPESWRPSRVVNPALPVITSPLVITPEKDIYNVGDSLEAEFSIKNIGDTPITLDVLTVGGRLNGMIPAEGAPDFTFQSVTLQPGESYQYHGSLTLTQQGNYRFFVAYHIENPTPEEKRLLDENNWNTCVELGEGLTHTDRVKNIIVYEEGTVPEEVSQLRETINRRIYRNWVYPTYLLDPEVSWVASVWMTVSSVWTHVQEKYEELYLAAVDHDCMSRIEASYAKRFLDRGDIDSARKHLQNCFVHEMISSKLFGAAAEVFDANVMVAEEHVKSTLKLIEVGVTLLNPLAGKFASYIFMVPNYIADRELVGVDQARKNSFIDLALKAIFSGYEYPQLGGRTLENYLNNRIGKITFPFLQEVFKNNEALQFYLSKALKKIVVEEAVWFSKKILDELSKRFPSQIYKKFSPVELRVRNSQGEITGLINGKVRHEISRSFYRNGTIMIFFPSDSYTCEATGKEKGTYGLEITSVEAWNVTTFNATDIPTSANAIHQYTIDWVALSQGEEGVTVQVDSDGDGTFEKTFTADNELTHDEFLKVAPEAFPMWIVGVAVATIAIATAAIAVFWRSRKQPPIKEFINNP